MVPLLFCVIIASLCGLVLPASIPDENEKYYTSKYDHVDIEMILNNRRLVNYYTACMMDRGPCPPEGLEFKRILPDALKTNCKKCTEKQKSVTLRAIKRLMKEYPKIWAQLKTEWDPHDKYVNEFISTYSNWESTPEPPTPMIVFDRFGDEESSPTPSTITNSTESASEATPGVFLPPIPPLSSSPPSQFNPIANSIGEGIKATVSFGTNIVGQVIRGIGDIGDRVIKTGVEIAGNIGNTVVKTRTDIAGALRIIARPV